MRQKYLILFAIMVLIAMMFFYFSSNIVYDKINRIKKFDRKIKVEQEKLNSAKVLNEQLQQVSKVIMNSMTKEKEYSADEVNEFTKKLADLADKYKIAVHSFFPKVISTVDTKFLEQLYTMELNCDYIQLGKLLADIESFDYIIKVKTIEVRPIGADKKKVGTDIETATRYKVTLELSTFKIIKEA